MKYVSYQQFLDTIPENQKLCLGESNLQVLYISEESDFELEKIKKQLEEAIEIIKLYQESTGDTCRLDHHGYCQEHWLDKEEDCPNFRANKLLKSLEE